MRDRWEELTVWTCIKWAADREYQGRYKGGGRRSDRHGHSPIHARRTPCSVISLGGGGVWWDVTQAAVKPRSKGRRCRKGPSTPSFDHLVGAAEQRQRQRHGRRRRQTLDTHKSWAPRGGA